MGNERKDYEARLAGLNLQKIWGTAMLDTNFPKGIDQLQTFYIAAAALGITTPDGIYDYYSDKTSVGDEHEIQWMTNRLVRVCEVTQEVWDLAKAKNPELHKGLTAPVSRTGVPGRHEDKNIPHSNQDMISPTGTPTGWAFPRLLILLKDEGIYNQGMLASLVSESATPVELLCDLSERMCETGIRPEKIMDLILKHQIRLDHNNTEMYFEVIEQLDGGKFELWEQAMERYHVGDWSEKKPGWVKIIDEYQQGVGPLDQSPTSRAG